MRKQEGATGLDRKEIRTLIDAILRLADDTHREMRRAIPPPVRVLRMVIMHGQARPLDIAEELDMVPSSVTLYVHELEEEGHVKIVRDPDHPLSSLVTPTRAGQEEMRKMDEAGEDVMLEVVASWTAVEVQTLTRALDRLVGDWTEFRQASKTKVT